MERQWKTWEEWYDELLEKIDWLYEHTDGITNDYIHDLVKTFYDVLGEAEERGKKLESAEDRLWNEVDSKYDREW